MTYKLLKTTLIAIVLATGLTAGASAHAQNAGKHDRVLMRDIEGIWVNQDYIVALRNSKMPHAVAKKTEPVVIVLRREGGSYPILITNFENAAVQVAVAVEPDEKPDSYRMVLAPDNKPVSSEKVKYMKIRGKPNAAGKLDHLAIAEIFFMKGKWATFVRVGDAIGPFVNGTVIAGRYIDEQGKTWEFSETGQATSPERTFYYELSLNDQGANCEYLEGEDLKAADGIKRIGFAWKGERLELFEAQLVKKRVRCESKPFAVLTRTP